jgi:hypothetical protein
MEEINIYAINLTWKLKSAMGQLSHLKYINTLMQVNASSETDVLGLAINDHKDKLKEYDLTSYTIIKVEFE